MGTAGPIALNSRACTASSEPADPRPQRPGTENPTDTPAAVQGVLTKLTLRECFNAFTRARHRNLFYQVSLACLRAQATTVLE